MGNYFSYAVTQGILFNESGYIFSNKLIECKSAHVLTIFYRYNTEENRTKLNSFLEQFSRGLLLHAENANIAYIILTYNDIKYVIFYALYEEQIYKYLTYISNMYTFIDKEPNQLQINDKNFRYYHHISLPTAKMYEFAKKYLEEFIFIVLCLNNDDILYNYCLPYKARLYYNYCINKEAFSLNVIDLITIKYNYYMNYNSIKEIIRNDIVQMHLICRHYAFTSRANELLLHISNDILIN